MNGWIEICALDDIPRLGARVLQRGTAVPIALFRTGADKVFALDDRCPHRGGPLSQGLVAGDRVVCPLHGWTIELSGGQAVAPDEGCAHSYAVEVRDGHVHLREADLVAADFVIPAQAGTNDPVVPAKAGTNDPVVPAKAGTNDPVVPAKAGTQCLFVGDANDAGFPPPRERQLL